MLRCPSHRQPSLLRSLDGLLLPWIIVSCIAGYIQASLPNLEQLRPHNRLTPGSSKDDVLSFSELIAAAVQDFWLYRFQIDDQGLTPDPVNGQHLCFQPLHTNVRRREVLESVRSP